MLSKNQISFIRSLHQKKYRDNSRFFIAEGVKLVSDLLQSSFSVREVFYNPSGTGDLFPGKFKTGAVFTEVSEQQMERITALTTPSPALAVIAIPDDHGEIPAPAGNDLILLLDDIRDPGNLGTIIRIADWFGITAIVVSEETVDPYNPKVVQSTMGSIARVKVIRMDPGKYLEDYCRNIPVYGTFMEGENIYETEMMTPAVVVTGNEARGISDEISSYVTKRISIPLSGRKQDISKPESLNASAATAIVCSEFRRRNLIR